ncbi:MAG: helicase HerA-like domain-containing protein, partial [Solirubrobacteraceae bacterium]
MENNKESFIKIISEGYSSKGNSIILGKGKYNNEVVTEATVSIPLKTLNRHGLIAGATGTGKTKTLQVLAEQLSLNGVPCLLMDLKGDLSGLGAKGDESNTGILERHTKLGIPFNSQSFPIEFLSLSKENGVRMRATVSEFGPILFSKILELNETQESIMSIVFKYCQDKKLPLVDLDDVKKVLQHISDTDAGAEEIKNNYGAISSTSIGTIIRKIVALEQQDAAVFFGEPSFDVEDLLQIDKNGHGMLNIIRLTDIQNKPTLFSTFMLSLLAEIYNTFPEQGDADKPKLAIFIDEAHLIFNEASKALLDQIETIIKLIRSKGVGIFFITQIPGDVPESILGQLGLKIQHALRGFTANDRKEIQKTIENYPTTEFYDADELITQLGIGEAFVTALNEKGIPTPLVCTYFIAPKSRMNILTPEEINTIVSNSDLVKEYNVEINKDTAYEILSIII